MIILSDVWLIIDGKGRSLTDEKDISIERLFG